MPGQLCSTGGAIRNTNASAGGVLVPVGGSGTCGCTPAIIGGGCSRFCLICCDSTGHNHNISSATISGVSPTCYVYYGPFGSSTFQPVGPADCANAKLNAFYVGTTNPGGGFTYGCQWSASPIYLGYKDSNTATGDSTFVPSTNPAPTPPSGHFYFDIMINVAFQITMDTTTGNFTARSSCNGLDSTGSPFAAWTSASMTPDKMCAAITAGPFTLHPRFTP